MFTIKGIGLITEPMEVMQELYRQLRERDIDLLRKFTQSGNNIQFCCPVHHDGQEKKPSAGITTSAKEGTPAGTIHCFSCGWISTLPELVSLCFGYRDKGKFGEDWLLRNFVTMAAGERRDLVLDMSRKRDRLQEQFVTEEELDKYRWFHPYMKQRKLTEEIIDLFDIGYDKEADCLTFPVRNRYGACVFVAKRSVKHKFFQYPPNAEKPVHGVYEITQKGGIDEVVICESIINSATSWIYGRPAFALMGLGSETQLKTIAASPIRRFIIGFDGDVAGQKSTEKIMKALKNHKIVSRLILPKGKDINDLSEAEFLALPEIF